MPLLSSCPRSAERSLPPSVREPKGLLVPRSSCWRSLLPPSVREPNGLPPGDFSSRRTSGRSPPPSRVPNGLLDAGGRAPRSSRSSSSSSSLPSFWLKLPRTRLTAAERSFSLSFLSSPAGARVSGERLKGWTPLSLLPPLPPLPLPPPGDGLPLPGRLGKRLLDPLPPPGAPGERTGLGTEPSALSGGRCGSPAPRTELGLLKGFAVERRMPPPSSSSSSISSSRRSSSLSS